MLCFRGLLLLSLVVSVSSVSAQEAPACPRLQRTIRFDQALATEVAEIYVSTVSSTTVYMPAAIRKGGITVTGGEESITVIQPPAHPNVLMLFANEPIGSEGVRLAVVTVDGKRYPFRVTTVSGVLDSEVRVVAWRKEEKCPSG